MMRNVYSRFSRASASSRLFATVSHRVAVVLSGCGVYDGSEITEAVAVIVHLSQKGCTTTFYAPDMQFKAVNHVTGADTTDQRNVMHEAARITRGKIFPLTELKASNVDAVIFPGGFGVAKHLSNFGHIPQKSMNHKEIDRVLLEFHKNKKPIGMCCIAPVLACSALKNVSVTLGMDDSKSGNWPHSSAISAIVNMGAKHEPKDVSEVFRDNKNLIVTTPAYMKNAMPHEVFAGIGKMVESLLSLLR